MYDDQGNYIGGAYEYAEGATTEAQQAWEEYYAEHGDEGEAGAEGGAEVAAEAEVTVEGDAAGEA